MAIISYKQAMERIAKVIARAGVCSRRQAERLIEQGRVTVNGAAITSPALNVSSTDSITVNGNPLPAAEATKLWMHYKPSGLVTTHHDPEGRPTVFDTLPKDLPDHIMSVGRLDQYSEGLLLLTNDGDLARKLEHPSSGIERVYRVKIKGDISQAQLDALYPKVTIDGVTYSNVKAKKRGAWIQITLVEGKNREIRNIISHLEAKVVKLIRLSYGPYQLKDLKPGEIVEVKITS
ncbi:MAG: pseudouridine synthase [Alphaproteobacteria bacterium]